jgi:hypothetical protein
MNKDEPTEVKLIELSNISPPPMIKNNVKKVVVETIKPETYQEFIKRMEIY